MTVIEAPPSAPPEATQEPRREARGLPAVLGSGDHKTIGRVWIGASALFLLLTVVVGVLLGVERITVNDLEVLGSDHVLQFFSLYRVGLTFLVVIPFFLGLATAIVPLQVGASSIAFPRAAGAALWTWLGGAVLLLVSYAIDGGPVAAPNLDPEAIALGVLGLGLVVLGLLMASICVVTTVFALRPVRMSLLQVPPFAWSMVVAGVIWLLSLPVLMAGLVLAYLDLRYGQLLFAQPGELYQRLSWVFAQPQVYAMAIPVLGVAAEIVPVSAGTVQRGRGALWIGIGGFGAFAFGAWAQPFYRSELLTEAVYVGFAFASGLAVSSCSGAWPTAPGRTAPPSGRPSSSRSWPSSCSSPPPAAGAAGVIEPFHLLGTSWEVGHLNLVLTASLLGALAALSWWSPKLWGRHVPAPLAFLAGLLIAGGGVVLAAAEGVAGILDQPAFSYAGFEPRDGVETFNVIASVGAGLFALGAIVLVLALLRAMVGR